MFLDGHKFHLSYHLSKLCSQSQIILITLPPNTTHMMQVLDVAIFHPVKQGCSVSVHEWRMTKLLEEDEPLTKFNFAPLLKKVLDQIMKKATIVNGFRACGLFPYNPDAVDCTKIENTMKPPKIWTPFVLGLTIAVWDFLNHS